MLTYALPAMRPADPPAAACVALGFFDGVHLAHAAVLAAARREATARRLPLLVYTFAGGDAPKGGAPLLTDDGERMRLFAAAGADYCTMAEFSAARTTPPEQFVTECLVGRLGAVCAVVGEDFRFGYRAAGDATLLERLLSASGGSVIAIPPVRQGGLPISSTRIREALAAGDVQLAAALLGRPYTLTLPVIHGEARGRTVGLPTANQALPAGRAAPCDGVYVTEATTEDGTRYRAVTDVGLRPTVGGGERRAETHLLDFAGDLYGRPLTVAYLARLRGELRLPDLAALAAQIKKDIEEAKRWKP